MTCLLYRLRLKGSVDSVITPLSVFISRVPLGAIIPFPIEPQGSNLGKPPPPLVCVAIVPGDRDNEQQWDL